MESTPAVGIVGAGTMGSGIALVCATAGYRVILFDVEASLISTAVAKVRDHLDSAVSKAKLTQDAANKILQHITTTTSLESVQAQYIIEAVLEDADTKQKVYEQLEAGNAPDALILTNTSSIPVSRLARKLRNPERFAGLHFFNPPSAMKLVEVIRGAATSDRTIERVSEFVNKLGKQAVHVQDSPGFIVNRVARLFYVEALKVLEEGVADHVTIDELMRSTGFRMGPFELMDLIGVDTNLSVTRSIYAAFNQEPRFRPSRIQQQKVDANLLGRKTGKGFYDYNA